MKCQPIDVIAVEILKDYLVKLQFDDGSSGIVDISEIVPFEGVFEPLNDPLFFAKLTINPDTGTICWENGADLSPAYLREKVQSEI